MTRSVFRAWLAFAIAMAVTWSAGCVFFPHRVRATPWVAGKLDSGGTPIANRSVRIVVTDGTDGARATCEGPSVHATTNEFGKFVLDPKHRMGWFMVVMAHQRFPWSLCIDVDGQWVPIKQNSDYTLGDTGPQWLTQLLCSVTQERQVVLANCQETHACNRSRSEVEQWLRRP